MSHTNIKITIIAIFKCRIGVYESFSDTPENKFIKNVESYTAAVI